MISIRECPLSHEFVHQCGRKSASPVTEWYPNGVCRQEISTDSTVETLLPDTTYRQKLIMATKPRIRDVLYYHHLYKHRAKLSFNTSEIDRNATGISIMPWKGILAELLCCVWLQFYINETGVNKNPSQITHELSFIYEVFPIKSPIFEIYLKLLLHRLSLDCKKHLPLLTFSSSVQPTSQNPANG